MKLILSLLILFMLVGCKATEPVIVSPHVHLHDEAFPDYSLFKVETAEEVFGLDDEARLFVHRAVMHADNEPEQIADLVEKIFDRSDFNMLYWGAANTIATDTFQNRTANCLSLSIMTYALAREAGFQVKFQDVDIPEYWTRREGYSLLNGHINLKIYPRQQANVINLLGSGYIVDFDPQTERARFSSKTVDKNTVLAMFYNNKGADALISNSYSKAYAYFREAVKIAPQFDSTWTNLGYLYRLHEHYDWAESSYRQALELKPGNLTALENMAYMFQLTDRQDEADEIFAKVERRRIENPYYHYILGEEEFEKENWMAALEHYREALRLDKSRHEIYYGLGKTYYQLGEMKRSQRYFEKAMKRSNNEEDRARYSGKLSLLTST